MDSIGAVSSTLDATEILDRTCEEAKRLFDARSAASSGLAVGRGRGAPGGERMIVPLAVHGERLGDLELTRAEPFHRWDHMRATVLADFAAARRELAPARGGARPRGRARAAHGAPDHGRAGRAAAPLLFLHDGPLQSMSGIALMHDAALAALQDGRSDDAAKVIENSLEKERDTIRVLRPLLRHRAARPPRRGLLRRRARARRPDRGDAPDHRPHGRRGGRAPRREDPGRALPDHPRVAEPGAAAAPEDRGRRRQREDGGFEAEIADDGVEEPAARRSRRSTSASRSSTAGSRSTAASTAARSSASSFPCTSPRPARGRLPRWTPRGSTCSSSPSRPATSSRARRPAARAGIGGRAGRGLSLHRREARPSPLPDDERPCAYLQAA